MGAEEEDSTGLASMEAACFPSSSPLLDLAEEEGCRTVEMECSDDREVEVEEVEDDLEATEMDRDLVGVPESCPSPDSRLEESDRLAPDGDLGRCLLGVG